MTSEGEGRLASLIVEPEGSEFPTLYRDAGVLVRRPVVPCRETGSDVDPTSAGSVAALAGQCRADRHLAALATEDVADPHGGGVCGFYLQ